MNVIKKMYKDCLLCELFLQDIYLSSSAKSAKTADSSRFDMNSEYKVACCSAGFDNGVQSYLKEHS